MTDKNLDNNEMAADGRRDFLKKAGKAAVVAPAVGLLLAAQSKSALAQAVSGGGGGTTCPPGTQLDPATGQCVAIP